MDIPAARLDLALNDGAMMEAWIDYYDRNARQRRAGGLWRLRPVCLGRLPVSSGELIAGDMVCGFDMTAPLEKRVPPGEYEVWATIAIPVPRSGLRRLLQRRHPDGPQEAPLVAFFTLLLAADKPARYELAVLRKQPGGDRPIDAFPGFGVDSGGAALMDASHVPAVQSLSSDDVWSLYDRLEAGPSEAAGRAMLIDLPTASPTPAVLSRSGWGDGGYLCYWGLDQRGAPVRLIVDFDLARD